MFLRYLSVLWALVILFIVIAAPANASAYARIGDTVWLDLNGDGIQDSTEPGVKDVQVDLYSTETGYWGTKTTNGVGFYRFTVLPGDYYLVFHLPEGYQFTKQDQGSDDAADSDADQTTGQTIVTTLDVLEDDMTWDAGIWQPSALGDFVWYDADSDGVQDGPGAGEPGIAGVKVILEGDTDGNGTIDVTRETTTDANGWYMFTNLVMGTYTVTVDTATVPDSYTNTYDLDSGTLNPDNTATVNLGFGETNLNLDFGYVAPPEECDVSIIKTADKPQITPDEKVTYSYTVKNTGDCTLTNVVVTDDNGTPDFPDDDFVVSVIPSLAAGQEVTFTVTKALPLNTYAKGDSGNVYAGQLITDVLPGGDVRVTFIQSRHLVDNTYGANSVGYKKSATFKDRVNSDNAQFEFTNGAGNVVLAFAVDYISASAAYPSGYGTLGVNGGDGSMSRGSKAHVLSCSTSLSDNLNQSPAYYGYTVDSPPEPNPGWEYENRYTVIVSAAAFGCCGFGSVRIPAVHNSPPKNDPDRYEPKPCNTEVTNTATVEATAPDGSILTATADATVYVYAGVDCDDGGCKPPKGKHGKHGKHGKGKCGKDKGKCGKNPCDKGKCGKNHKNKGKCGGCGK